MPRKCQDYRRDSLQLDTRGAYYKSTRVPTIAHVPPLGRCRTAVQNVELLGRPRVVSGTSSCSDVLARLSRTSARTSSRGVQNVDCSDVLARRPKRRAGRTVELHDVERVGENRTDP